METLYSSMAGIDVHKKMLAVVVRKQSGEQVGYDQRKFGTTRAEIQHLQSWLRARPRRSSRTSQGICRGALRDGRRLIDTIGGASSAS